MGKILVHEFISLDGVIEKPVWTFQFPFDERTGVDIGSIVGSSEALLLGRQTYVEFAPAWSSRTAEQDPGAPFNRPRSGFAQEAVCAATEMTTLPRFWPVST